MSYHKDSISLYSKYESAVTKGSDEEEETMSKSWPRINEESKTVQEKRSASCQQIHLVLDEPELIRATGLRGNLNSVRKKLTCGCSKVTVRVVKFGISLWMIADMISDAINTKHYLDYARVRYEVYVVQGLAERHPPGCEENAAGKVRQKW